MNLLAFTGRFANKLNLFTHAQKLKKKEKESFEKDNNLEENLVWVFSFVVKTQQPCAWG